MGWGGVVVVVWGVGGDGREGETRFGGGSKTCDGANRGVVLGRLLKRSAALKLGHFIVELRLFQRLFPGFRRRRVGGFLVGRWFELRFGRRGLGSGMGSGSGAMIGAHGGPHCRGGRVLFTGGDGAHEV